MEISFKVDGKMRTFSKDKIYFRDNIRAVKHQIIQGKYFEEEINDPEKYEEMQADFCRMIADIFNNEFSAEQLRDNFLLEDRERLEEIYILALGGTIKKETDEEKK